MRAAFLCLLLTACGPVLSPQPDARPCPPNSSARPNGFCECDRGAQDLPDGGWECAPPAVGQG